MAEHVCPWWLGYLLASPIRRIWHKPEEIIAPYVMPGMTVLEIGAGMGYFTIPMARAVGDRGKIVCVDIQEKMLKGLEKRAGKAGVADLIVTRLASHDSQNIDDFAGRIDFAFAFAVVHEIPDQANLFRQIHDSMKPGALILISEPAGHVTKEAFEKMITLTKGIGFVEISRPNIKREISAVLKKG